MGRARVGGLKIDGGAVAPANQGFAIVQRVRSVSQVIQRLTSKSQVNQLLTSKSQVKQVVGAKVV